MNYNTIYQAMTKKAYINYGGGSVANDVHNQLESARNKNIEIMSKTPIFGKSMAKTYSEQTAPALRQLEKTIMDPMVSKANRESAMVGGAFGLGGAGLTYAGLSLIPALKKKRILKGIIALLSGGALGAWTGHNAGRMSFDQQLGQAIRGGSKPQA